MKISTPIRSRAALVAAVALLALAFASTAFASLGGDASTVENDGARMKATKRVTTQSSKYTVQEIQTDAGTTVKEFVSPQGTVFAVSWEGPVMPNLQQLFGSYYDQYRQALVEQRQGPVRRRGPIFVQQPGLVVQSGGHMRYSMGRAYIPDLLPAGVQPQELR